MLFILLNNLQQKVAHTRKIVEGNIRGTGWDSIYMRQNPTTHIYQRKGMDNNYIVRVMSKALQPFYLTYLCSMNFKLFYFNMSFTKGLLHSMKQPVR